MWVGQTSVDSHGAPASPAMTTWFNGVSETLVLAWGGSDGTVYAASGMEQSGVISATPLSNISTLERFALVELEPGLLAISYTSTDNAEWYAPFPIGALEFLYLDTWAYPGGVLIPPDIGGPALLPQGGNLFIAGTAQDSQNVYFGFGPAPDAVLPSVAAYNNTSLLSIDTPALGITPSGQMQLAFAGANEPDNSLTVQPDPGSGPGLTPPVVYPDQCFGGPALVTTVNGYAAAYANKMTNIVLLYGMENLDPQNINRVVLQDTSWHAPAIVTLNGVTYVAWIGTDDPNNNTGRLYFADLGSMNTVTCAVDQLLKMEAGKKAGEIDARLHYLRDTTFAAEASGRWLVALLDQHSAELGRLLDSDADLRRRAWDLLQQVEPIATSIGGVEMPVTNEAVAAAEGLLHRVTVLASPPVQQSARQLSGLLGSLRGRTLANGLALASRSFQD